MSTAEKPCTPAGYEQSPSAQPLSPAKKRRKAQRSNSTAQGGPASAAQQSDTMPMTSSNAAGMKMMDSEVAAAASGSMMMQRGSFDDGSMAMQAAIGGQQQQMMAAVQHHGHQRHALYPGAQPVVSGPTEHLLQSQGMGGGRAAMGHMNLMPGQGMYGYAVGVCGGCRRDVQENSQAVICRSGCNLWFHRQCSGLSEFAYQLLIKEPCAEWVCDSCHKQKSIPPMRPRMNNS